MSELDELRERLANMENDIDFLKKREKALFDDYTRLSDRFFKVAQLDEKRLTMCEDREMEDRENIYFLMDKVFPDNCTYTADIDRALQAPSKPKG